MKKIIAIALGLVTIALAISTYLSITKGGASFVLEVTAKPDSNMKKKNETEILNKCCEILSKRCESSGATEVKVYPQKQEDGQPDKIKIELQGIKVSKHIEALLTNSVSFGFWETYVIKEVQPFLLTANTNLRTLLADSLKASSMIEKEYPLSSLLQSNSENSPNSPIIGYAVAKDMATINNYLKIPEVQALFPKDLRFKWSASPLESGDNLEIFGLYAIKSTNRNEKALLEEDAITDAECINDYSGRPCISITMSAYGSRQWEKITRQNIGRSIAMVINNNVYSAPHVNCEITGGKSEISGEFTKEEAQNLAILLKSGTIPASIKVVESTIIPDSQWSLNKYLLTSTLICVLALIFILMKRK